MTILSYTASIGWHSHYWVIQRRSSNTIRCFLTVSASNIHIHNDLVSQSLDRMVDLQVLTNMTTDQTRFFKKIETSRGLIWQWSSFIRLSSQQSSASRPSCRSCAQTLSPVSYVTLLSTDTGSGVWFLVNAVHKWVCQLHQTHALLVEIWSLINQLPIHEAI